MHVPSPSILGNTARLALVVRATPTPSSLSAALALGSRTRARTSVSEGCVATRRSLHSSYAVRRDVPAPSSSSSSDSRSGQSQQSEVREQDQDQDQIQVPDARQSARARAWYLDPEPEPELNPASRSGTPPVRSDSSPSSSSSTATAPPPPRQPIFTTFDPHRTLPSPASRAPIAPLPSTAPAWLEPLHAFMHASTLLEGGSVAFMRAGSGSGAADGDGWEGEGAGVRSGYGHGYGRGRTGGEELRSGAEPHWEWVVCATVAGRGKGVVGRAERELRTWLKDNPTPELRTLRPPRRMPRVEADTDWSVVAIGERLCVHLFTPEGRERWALDDLWGGREAERERERDRGRRRAFGL